jgi:hypothetical protein
MLPSEGIDVLPLDSVSVGRCVALSAVRVKFWFSRNPVTVTHSVHGVIHIVTHSVTYFVTHSVTYEEDLLCDRTCRFGR